jgi:[acyl-carrier-protein] S-malonyltransferase
MPTFGRHFYFKAKPMKAYVFPGQGSQVPGMGKELYENSATAKGLMEQANEILGFRITDIMFSGTEDDLKQTNVTQPSIFLHSVSLAKSLGNDFNPGMVAGHSLGEFSALVASQTLTFEDGLTLVAKRANAMQKACELKPSTMAAVTNLPDEVVEKICAQFEGVVPANYNCPGQIAVSGPVESIEAACVKFLEAGAKRALVLKVGGAFHSPLMEPAKIELEHAINSTRFSRPVCPVYQNVTARPTTDPDDIRKNLVAQLTAPVLWTQTIENMIRDGATSFIELGPGKVLQNLVKKVDRDMEAIGMAFVQTS